MRNVQKPRVCIRAKRRDPVQHHNELLAGTEGMLVGHTMVLWPASLVPSPSPPLAAREGADLGKGAASE